MVASALSACLVVDGEWIPATARETLPLIDPASAEEIGRVPVATADDLDRALQAVDAAQPVWSKRPLADRATLLARVAQLLRERSQEIAETLTREQGKVLSEALGEVETSAAIFGWYAGEVRRVYGRIVPADSENVELRVVRVPVGPTAIFTPWNFPLVEPAAHVAAALAAGCCVILKVSEETPLSGSQLLQAIHDAGIPPGVAHLVTGDPVFISDHLLRSRVIRKIAFTGSVAVGKQLAAKAGELMKPSTMELGGNAPAIVFEDVEIGRAAALIASAKCRNAGQVCTVPNRIFVHDSIFEGFLREYLSVLSRVRIGPGRHPESQMGPLANVRRSDAMDDLVADAQSRGAVVAIGGRRRSPGYFYENTVLVRPPEDARLSTEEIFGPISPIFTFEDESDVIRRANATPVGLAAYVFSGDRDRAQYVAAALEAGSVAVNHTRVLFPEAPFGGVKESGFGRICGPEGLDGYLVPKLISVEHAAAPPVDRQGATHGRIGIEGKERCDGKH
jgi:succinate-semialdehyde dehydrogenase/glutarate-semialdehyde dehydrogenase